MDLFLMCCLFLLSWTPERMDDRSLAAANALERTVNRGMQVILDTRDGASDPDEALRSLQTVLASQQARLDPVFVQRHPDADTEQLNALWKEHSLLAGQAAFDRRVQQAMEESGGRMLERQQLMEASGGYQEPVYEAEPRKEALLPGIADLPQAAGGAGGQDDWLSTACPAYSPGEIVPAGSLINPVPGSFVSAGTWAYPQGGLHLGLDLAAPLYSDLIAPASGLVLYQSAGQPSDSGYPGNTSGYPGGAGNSILLLCPVKDRLFSVAFYHLSSIHYVRPGQTVTQGDVIALTGNAGNSTGPHTHVEICELKMSLEEAAAYFAQTADFSFGTGWDTPAACSQAACRRRPEELLDLSSEGNA